MILIASLGCDKTDEKRKASKGGDTVLRLMWQELIADVEFLEACDNFKKCKCSIVEERKS